MKGHLWEQKAQSFKLLLNKETGFAERLSKTNSKQFIWRSSYLMSKLSLSVSQTQEHSHLVLSVCSQPAASCFIPNLYMSGFGKTICCVLVHQNQRSHHSMHVREGLKQMFINITPCCWYSSSCLGLDSPGDFHIHPTQKKDSGADFAPTEVLSTSQTSGFLSFPVFWNKQNSWNPMSQPMWTFGVCFHWCSIDFTRINVNITLACNC